jgi:hypothetical protein
MTMRRTVVTCAGLLALLLAQQVQAACATVPQLYGDPALVASVTEALTRRGGAGLGSDCSPLQVQLSWQDGHYAVAIQDPSGRRSERQVASVEMVATLIETWMVPGIGEPAPAPAPPTPPSSPAPPLMVAVVAPPTPPRLVLSAQAESALANDSSLWMGLGAMACLRWGRFCPGMLMRFADDEGWSGNNDGATGSRRSVEALLASHARIPLGRVRLLPRLGVGIAWTWGGEPKGRHDEGPPPQDNRGRLRVEAGITGQLVVRERWALSLDLSSELAPLALDTRISDPRALHEPWIFTRLGLGVAWGTP